MYRLKRALIFPLGGEGGGGQIQRNVVLSMSLIPAIFFTDSILRYSAEEPCVYEWQTEVLIVHLLDRLELPPSPPPELKTPSGVVGLMGTQRNGEKRTPPCFWYTIIGDVPTYVPGTEKTC